MQMTNKYGDRGSPCLNPLVLLEKLVGLPLISTEKDAVDMNLLIQLYIYIYIYMDIYLFLYLYYTHTLLFPFFDN